MVSLYSAAAAPKSKLSRQLKLSLVKASNRSGRRARRAANLGLRAASPPRADVRRDALRSVTRFGHRSEYAIGSPNTLGKCK
eukprot:5983417-Pleurochrysis_carterae.AAC.1